LVTGCASGLGLALVRALVASRSFRVVATARDSSLPRMATAGLEDGLGLRLLPLDVTQAPEREQAISAIERQWGGVDILINNAGISFRAAMEEMSVEEEGLQMATNYLGPLSLCRLVLPHMRAQRWGRILNVSSVSGMMAMPTMGSYSASKWALEGASEALWYELRPWGIGVTLVQPGFLHSDGFQKVRLPEHAVTDTQGEAAYRRYYESMSPFIARLMARSRSTPELVAARMLALLHRRRPRLRSAVTFDARCFYLLRRLLPRRLYHEVLYRSLPGVRHWIPEMERTAGLPKETGGSASAEAEN